MLIASGVCQGQNGLTVQPYEWKNVQIVGGGFCDGIIFHPTAPGVRYARTDMGGAYRWDAAADRWMPLLDFVSYADNNLVGVESIAVDPLDPKTVYLDCGTYTSSTNGAIFYSHDGGLTFGRTDVPFKMGGNENGRGNGERMMVDPNNTDVIYVGTRQAGLWMSDDKARSFRRVDSFDEALAPYLPKEMTSMEIRQSIGCGVVFVVFDPQSGKPGNGSQIIFVGYSQMNPSTTRPSTLRCTPTSTGSTAGWTARYIKPTASSAIPYSPSGTPSGHCIR